jgi:hypothetical protein
MKVPPVYEKPRVLEWRPKTPATRPADPRSRQSIDAAKRPPRHRPDSLEPPSAEPLKYLLELGVQQEALKHLQVLTEGKSFDFKTGTWKK